MLIRLEYVYPPIPDRRHDWLAYDDDDPEDTSMQGWGRTKREALRELADRLEEDDESQTRRDIKWRETYLRR